LSFWAFGACFCSSSSALSSCFFKWHLPWQELFLISFLTQSVLAILSWLILKETTIHILLKGCKKMRSANMYVVTCFNSGAKVIHYVLVSLSKCLFFCQSVRWFAVGLKWHITVCGYKKGGTFTTKLNLKNYCFINHKTVFGTRNPAFWVAAVTCWRFLLLFFHK